MLVPAASHRLVSLALMETFVRYNRVLAQNPQLLSRILGIFLGENGMGHADEVKDSAPGNYLLPGLTTKIKPYSLKPYSAGHFPG